MNPGQSGRTTLAVPVIIGLSLGKLPWPGPVEPVMTDPPPVPGPLVARPTPVRISSPANPRVRALVRLRKPRERRVAGVRIAEGRREVMRALDAGLACREWWWCPEHFFANSSGPPGPPGPPDPRLLGVPGVEADAAAFGKVAWHREPEGLLAVFAAPETDPDRLTLPRGRLLVAVGTEKPGNFGAMVRTAAAAGCDGVLAVGPATDPFNPNAIRNSTGAVFATPLGVVPDDDAAVAWLRDRRVRVAAALADASSNGTPDPADRSHSCFDADLTASAERPLAVVIGPEHAGLSAAWRAAADLRISVPTAAGVVDSLNAAAAAAVLLFEVARQNA